jgi:hypothetical protein
MNAPRLTSMRTLRNVPRGIETKRIPQGINNRCRWGGELNSLNSNNAQLEGYDSLQPGSSYDFSGRENFQERRVHNIGGMSPDQAMIVSNTEHFRERNDRKTTNFLLFIIAGLLMYKLFIVDDRRNII